MCSATGTPQQAIRLKFYSHSSIKWKPVVEKFTNIQRLNKMHQHNQRAEEKCKAVEELTNTHRIWQKQLWEGSSDAYTHEEFTRCDILYSKNEIKNRLRPKLEGGEADNNESRNKWNKENWQTFTLIKKTFKRMQSEIRGDIATDTTELQKGS